MDRGNRTGEVLHQGIPIQTFRPLNILVVDDYPDAAETLGELVSLLGHHARTAPNAREAVHLARLLTPDVVLLDIGLPDADGYSLAEELCRELSQRPLLIVVTGFMNTEGRSRVAGIDHHFIKPIEAKVLEDVLRQHAEKLIKNEMENDEAYAKREG